MRSFCLTIFLALAVVYSCGRCGSGRSAADKPDASGAGNGARQCAEQSCVHPVSKPAFGLLPRPGHGTQVSAGLEAGHTTRITGGMTGGQLEDPRGIRAGDAP